MKNLNSTVVLIGSIVIGLLIFVGLMFFISSNKEEEQVTLPVTLVAFSDFQCPACGAYYPLLEQIRSEFPEDEFQFEHKHFPLTSIHEYAYTAAIASEAAREQGKFEEYYRILFENQENLTMDDLINYAKELDLDIEKFEADMQNEEVIARVDRDLAEANDRGFNSTPTFLLDGKRLSVGSDPEESMRSAIQERIDMAKAQAEQSE